MSIKADDLTIKYLAVNFSPEANNGTQNLRISTNKAHKILLLQLAILKTNILANLKCAI